MEQTTGAASGTGAYEPLRLCIYTTIALIAWAVGPPLAVAMFAGLGLVGYVRAHRAGLRRTRCWLGDSRLVIAYLGVALTLGAAVAVRGLVRLIT
jgi:hypothetical protein